MICERYWREGIVLFERGLDDPHRAGCEDCRRAHASRHELIEALPLIGAEHTGDPRWQAKVWERIDGERPRAPWRWRWQLAGALAVACLVALWIGLGRDAPVMRPRLDIIKRGVAMRSLGAHVDDGLRVTVGEGADVWIYRAGRLVASCRAGQASDRCAPDAHGMVVELPLRIPGTYDVIITAAPFPAGPRGSLDEDRAALESSGASYTERQVSVR